MHAYPHNLAAKLRSLWDVETDNHSDFGLAPMTRYDPLPAPAILERLISVCYQASLLREENRPVRFRLALITPEQVRQNREAGAAPLQRLAFARPIPFQVNELRRLGPAADFEQTMIGVRLNLEGVLEVWGLMDTGRDWIRALEGSRRLLRPLPPVLIMGVVGPGHLAACKGSSLVVRLVAGKLSVPTPGVLELTADATDKRIQAKILSMHAKARRQAKEPWAKLDSSMVERIRRSMAYRTISAMRKLQHGGTLLLLPGRLGEQPELLSRYVQMKYRFAGTEVPRYLHLEVICLLNELAASYGRLHGSKKVVTWNDYLASTDPRVQEVDEGISNYARLIASTSTVDGAVVFARPGNFLGFGAEILGNLPKVDYVARSLNQDGSLTDMESTDGVGTRHRSVYRLCQALPQAIGIVVSQDGGLRLIRKVRRRVTYWEQASFGRMMV